MPLRMMVIGLASVMASSLASAAQSAGVSILPGDPLSAFVLPGGNLRAEVVDVAGQTFGKALRLQTLVRPKQPYEIQIGQRTTAPIAKGDVLVGTFYVRMIEAEAVYGRTDLILENITTYEKSIYYAAAAGKAWRKFTVPFVAIEDEPEGRAQVNFHLGFSPQTIELGGISVVNYGKSRRVTDFTMTAMSYDGREPNAAWRRAADARIEKYRKATLTVNVVDAAGKPLPGAQVQVRMKRHAFAFGSEIDAWYFLENSPDARRYHDTVLKWFNKVVLGNALKWPVWDGDWGNRRADTMRTLKELRDHGIKVRGHNLVWPGWSYLPKSVVALKNDPAALRGKIDDHIVEELTALEGICCEWDVVNEPYDNRDLMNILGGDAIMAEWYNRAHDTDPRAQLFLNDQGYLENGGDDTTHQQTFDQQIAMLKAKGHLGGVGVEGHFSQILTPPDRLLALLDRLSRQGLPIQINEFDVDVPDEQLQADYLRDFMTVMFSHPNVQGVVMWGFWAPRHWLPSAALVRPNWTLKPNGQAWFDLVFHHWWTNADLVTTGAGRCSTRGFLGDYEISASTGSLRWTVPATLVRDGTTVTVTMR